MSIKEVNEYNKKMNENENILKEIIKENDDSLLKSEKMNETYKITNFPQENINEEMNRTFNKMENFSEHNEKNVSYIKNMNEDDKDEYDNNDKNEYDNNDKDEYENNDKDEYDNNDKDYNNDDEYYNNNNNNDDEDYNNNNNKENNNDDEDNNSDSKNEIKNEEYNSLDELFNDVPSNKIEEDLLNNKQNKTKKVQKYKIKKKRKHINNNESENENTNKKQKKSKLHNKENEFIDDIAEENEDEVEDEVEDEDAYIEENQKEKNNSYDIKKKIKNKVYDDEEYNNDSNYLFDEEDDDYEKQSFNKHKEKTHFDEVLENLKGRKRKTNKISDDEGLQYCESFLNKMITIYEEDLKAMKEGKPATGKLQVIDHVCKVLTKPKWKNFFIRLNVFHVLELWLTPLYKNSLPSYTIRSKILKVITELPITINSLKGLQLGKILTYFHSHKQETTENKNLIKNILQNIVGPIIGINTNYKKFVKERQKKILQNPTYHKKVLEKAKTLVPDCICIEKEEEVNEKRKHALIPFNSECSFLINAPSSLPTDNRKNVQKSKIKRLTDSMKLNKRLTKTHKVSIEGKGVSVIP